MTVSEIISTKSGLKMSSGAKNAKVESSWDSKAGSSGFSVNEHSGGIKVRSRRTSSINSIKLGDTIPSFATLHESRESRSASIDRMKFLSVDLKNDKTLLKKIWISYREISYRHTWITPFLMLLLVYGLYFTSGNRTLENPLHKFIFVTYRLGDTDQYGKGINDLYFVFFHMIFFTFLREFLMDVIIRRLCNKLGITSSHKRKRMMEQIYSLVYYGISGPFGIYIMYHSNLWLFKTDTMYMTYPDLNNSYLFKLFYLGQASFWAQQGCILVLQLEKPRKDHKELVFHHVITLLLIWSSYVFHFTNIGLAVYITMDVSDFFLSLSKTLNYLESPLTSPVFALFVFCWIYLRHYINIKILWSVLTEFKTEGSYVLNFATQQYKCWISLPMVFTLILALQLVNILWLFFILRILFRIVFYNIEKDDRSDTESEDSDYEELKEFEDELLLDDRLD